MWIVKRTVFKNEIVWHAQELTSAKKELLYYELTNCNAD